VGEQCGFVNEAKMRCEALKGHEGFHLHQDGPRLWLWFDRETATRLMEFLQTWDARH